MNTLMNCGTCVWWDEDKVSNEWGYCSNDKLIEMINVGYCDEWDFHRDFGCCLWSSTKES